MAGILSKIKQKLSRAGNKMDEYHEAITFAEAGHSEFAMETMAEQREELVPTKLLVVGRESAFSNEIVDYAMEMAQRMSYDILALNTAPLSCETFKLFSSSRDKLCEEFKGLSLKNAELFRQAADEQGISFDHVIKFSEPDEAMEAVMKEHPDIAFVVSETVEDREESRSREGERLHSNVYVYSVV